MSTSIKIAIWGAVCLAALLSPVLPLGAQQTHVDEISVDARATFHQQTEAGVYSTHFQGDYFNIHIAGHLTDDISFRVRQRMNKKIDAENPFNATDLLWLRWQAGSHWSFTLGKQPILIGGCGVEYFPLGNDNLRLHAVFFRDNHDRINNYDLGVTWRFKIYSRAQ